MSNNELRVARELAAPLVQGECRPIVFEERRPRTGKGGAAFKSLTAAVRAAEREREECRGYKVAVEVVLEEARRELARVEAVWRAEKRLAIRLLWLAGAIFVGCVVTGCWFS